MAFRLSMLLDADASQAKAALGETRAAVDATKKSARDLGQEGRRAAQGVNTLSRAADGAEAQVRQLSAAEKQAAADALRLGRSGKMAAGSMGNLVAQFNDIGMMMMAGQNPLQLAVQQGTQITQVIGPMGAAGAVRALGSAFVSMLNPVNLITIGAIAAGAAMVGWLTGAREDAAELEDLLEGMGEAIEAFEERADEAALSSGRMIEQFGSASPAMRAVLTDLVALSKIDAYRAIDETSKSVRDLVLDLSFWDDRSSRSASQDFLGLGNMSSSARAAGDEFARNLELLSQSQEPAVKLQAALDLREQLLEAAGGVAQLNGEQRRFYEGLAAIIRDLELMGAKVREAEQAMQSMSAFHLQSLSVLLDEVDAAEAIRVSLQERERMAALIATHGADSIEVAQARADAEGDALREQIEALGVSEELKQELLAALEAVLAIEGSNMAEAIGAGADQAARLAENLAAARGARLDALTGNNPDFFDPRNEAGLSGVIQRDRPVPRENRPGYKPPGRARGGRSAGASLDREREAVERLIEREREQLELLRATDPVQKELIRNREILASATDAERMQVEQLISARIEEREAMEMAQRQTEFWRDNIYDALEGAVFRSESLADVLNNVVGPALLKAAVLGEGPLGGLFGGQGLLGLVFPALKKADGGYITGSGGPREDKVPIMGSAGEFMVNAKATNRYRHLLEHINSGGDVPGYATGGLVGSVPAPTPLGAQTAADQRPAQVEILLAEGLRARILGDARQQTAVMIREFSRVQLPGRVEAITNDPGARG